MSVKDIALTAMESNFIGQIGADLLIRTGKAPTNNEIMKEVIFRAMMVKGSDVPTH